jgi:hypothetical protein
MMGIAEPNRVNQDNIEYVPLKVTAGVLLHIGAGIYNSPAGAIKELVSNSFDADATFVTISTDYPDFDEFKIVDNGSGMSADHLKLAMQSIGSSLKGTLEERTGLTPIYERPIIGHLGIGLMALSQVCDEAEIESQIEGSDNKFVAILNFADIKKLREQHNLYAKLEGFRDKYGGIEQMKRLMYDPDIEDEIRSQIESDYKLAQDANEILEERLKDEEIDLPEGESLGYCYLFKDLPAVKGERGTVITLRQIEKGVKALLMEEGRNLDEVPLQYRESEHSWAEYRALVNQWSWEELCRRLRLRTNGLNYQSLPQYHQFLWELSLLTPVPYANESPVTIQPEILKDKKDELKKFNFSLSVDNRIITKPILLPSGDLAKSEEDLELEFDFYIEPIDLDEVIEGSRLNCSGYLFWQRKQIQPSTVRGIHIFIRNVGIGLYDNSILNFANVNVTSRAGQLSGEIYVDEGLERALNVDRNSFRETDAHYLAIQKRVWKILGSTSQGDGILGMSVKAFHNRRQRRDTELFVEHQEELKNLIYDVTNGKLSLAISERDRREPYEIKRDKLIVNINSPRWPRARKERLHSQRILGMVKAAIKAGATVDEILTLLESELLRK